MDLGNLSYLHITWIVCESKIIRKFWSENRIKSKHTIFFLTKTFHWKKYLVRKILVTLLFFFYNRNISVNKNHQAYTAACCQQLSLNKWSWFRKIFSISLPKEVNIFEKDKNLILLILITFYTYLWLLYEWPNLLPIFSVVYVDLSCNWEEVIIMRCRFTRKVHHLCGPARFHLAQEKFIFVSKFFLLMLILKS